MSDVMLPVVFAQALQTGIRLRNERELVEDPDTGEVHEVTVPVNAVPGQIIDVTGWANIGAYVERGQIMLLTAAQTAQVLEDLREATTTGDADSRASTGSSSTRGQGKNQQGKQPAKTSS